LIVSTQMAPGYCALIVAGRPVTTWLTTPLVTIANVWGAVQVTAVIPVPMSATQSFWRKMTTAFAIA
jgi:hypothetical protein